jgi:lauroyl/myristoyl acyltransferase
MPLVFFDRKGRIDLIPTEGSYMSLRAIGDYLVYLVVRILICLVQAIPLSMGIRLARVFAWLFCDVLQIRGAVTEENLAHAFPALSAAARRRLARRMWEHLFLLVLEVAQTPRKIHETNWRDFIKLKDEEFLVRRLLEGKPLLLVTGHLGNFEVGGYVLIIAIWTASRTNSAAAPASLSFRKMAATHRSDGSWRSRAF